MCNLYSLTRAPAAIAALFRVPHNRAVAYTPKPAIFPGHTAPIVRMTADGDREMVEMSWGFVLPQAGKAPRRVTNVRDDKARTSAFWRSSFMTRRCLVPATSFAEPHDGRTPATWHWFARTGEDPRPPFAFAGVWRRWHGPVKKDGPAVDLDTFAFMTTVPNALTASVNHERSPVLIVSDAAQERWLKGAPDDAFELARPYPADRLRLVREGFEKADPVAAA
jgi:putative SOS response-associated peptidase YedK